ncbi:MAG: LytTR family DNA-binding domain-containing protein [Lachnospiraceae bacterium]|nr:LytTR family DNA-binding domain-containing protein [Lachnospiraceae bacterium]
MKKALILEDKTQEVEALKQIILKLEPEAVIYTMSDLPTAYMCAMEHDISLFLVDIVLHPGTMGDTSGLDFAKGIRAISKYEFVPIIFITGLSDPQLYAYKELHCYGYIEKPIFYSETEERIASALRFELTVPENDTIVLQKDRMIFSIRKKDIVYIESQGNKLSITTVDDTINFFYLTTKKLMEMLQSDDFFWCKRGTVVNKRYVQQIDASHNMVELIPPYGKIPIGIIMKRELLKNFSD